MPSPVPLNANELQQLHDWSEILYRQAMREAGRRKDAGLGTRLNTEWEELHNAVQYGDVDKSWEGFQRALRTGGELRGESSAVREAMDTPPPFVTPSFANRLKRFKQGAQIVSPVGKDELAIAKESGQQQALIQARSAQRAIPPERRTPQQARSMQRLYGIAQTGGLPQEAEFEEPSEWMTGDKPAALAKKLITDPGIGAGALLTKPLPGNVVDEEMYSEQVPQSLGEAYRMGVENVRANPPEAMAFRPNPTDAINALIRLTAPFNTYVEQRVTPRLGLGFETAAVVPELIAAAAPYAAAGRVSQGVSAGVKAIPGVEGALATGKMAATKALLGRGAREALSKEPTLGFGELVKAEQASRGLTGLSDVGTLGHLTSKGWRLREAESGVRRAEMLRTGIHGGVPFAAARIAGAIEDGPGAMLEEATNLGVRIPPAGWEPETRAPNEVGPEGMMRLVNRWNPITGEGLAAEVALPMMFRAGGAAAGAVGRRLGRVDRQIPPGGELGGAREAATTEQPVEVDTIQFEDFSLPSAEPLVGTRVTEKAERIPLQRALQRFTEITHEGRKYKVPDLTIADRTALLKYLETGRGPETKQGQEFPDVSSPLARANVITRGRRSDATLEEKVESKLVEVYDKYLQGETSSVLTKIRNKQMPDPRGVSREVLDLVQQLANGERGNPITELALEYMGWVKYSDWKGKGKGGETGATDEGLSPFWQKVPARLRKNVQQNIEELSTEELHKLKLRYAQQEKGFANRADLSDTTKAEWKALVKAVEELYAEKQKGKAKPTDEGPEDNGEGGPGTPSVTPAPTPGPEGPVSGPAPTTAAPTVEQAAPSPTLEAVEAPAPTPPAKTQRLIPSEVEIDVASARRRKKRFERPVDLKGAGRELLDLLSKARGRLSNVGAVRRGEVTPVQPPSLEVETKRSARTQRAIHRIRQRLALLTTPREVTANEAAFKERYRKLVTNLASPNFDAREFLDTIKNLAGIPDKEGARPPEPNFEALRALRDKLREHYNQIRPGGFERGTPEKPIPGGPDIPARDEVKISAARLLEERALNVEDLLTLEAGGEGVTRERLLTKIHERVGTRAEAEKVLARRRTATPADLRRVDAAIAARRTQRERLLKRYAKKDDVLTAYDLLDIADRIRKAHPNSKFALDYASALKARYEAEKSRAAKRAEEFSRGAPAMEARSALLAAETRQPAGPRRQPRGEEGVIPVASEATKGDAETLRSRLEEVNELLALEEWSVGRVGRSRTITPDMAMYRDKSDKETKIDATLLATAMPGARVKLHGEENFVDVPRTFDLTSMQENGADIVNGRFKVNGKEFSIDDIEFILQPRENLNLKPEQVLWVLEQVYAQQRGTGHPLAGETLTRREGVAIPDETWDRLLAHLPTLSNVQVAALAAYLTPSETGGRADPWTKFRTALRGPRDRVVPAGGRTLLRALYTLQLHRATGQEPARQAGTLPTSQIRKKSATELAAQRRVQERLEIDTKRELKVGDPLTPPPRAKVADSPLPIARHPKLVREMFETLRRHLRRSFYRGGYYLESRAGGRLALRNIIDTLYGLHEKDLQLIQEATFPGEAKAISRGLPRDMKVKTVDEKGKTVEGYTTHEADRKALDILFSAIVAARRYQKTKNWKRAVNEAGFTVEVPVGRTERPGGPGAPGLEEQGFVESEAAPGREVESKEGEFVYEAPSAKEERGRTQTARATAIKYAERALELAEQDPSKFAFEEGRGLIDTDVLDLISLIKEQEGKGRIGPQGVTMWEEAAGVEAERLIKSLKDRGLEIEGAGKMTATPRMSEILTRRPAERIRGGKIGEEVPLDITPEERTLEAAKTLTPRQERYALTAISDAIVNRLTTIEELKRDPTLRPKQADEVNRLTNEINELAKFTEVNGPLDKYLRAVAEQRIAWSKSPRTIRLGNVVRFTAAEVKARRQRTNEMSKLQASLAAQLQQLSVYFRNDERTMDVINSFIRQTQPGAVEPRYEQRAAQEIAKEEESIRGETPSAKPPTSESLIDPANIHLTVLFNPEGETLPANRAKVKLDTGEVMLIDLDQVLPQIASDPAAARQALSNFVELHISPYYLGKFGKTRHVALLKQYFDLTPATIRQRAQTLKAVEEMGGMLPEEGE